MSHPWSSILTVLSKITRENSDFLVFCPHGGNRHSFVKWGFYSRYSFDDSLINIQRYRCNNDLCPCKTFSILPHAFLPIIRASLYMLIHILKMYENGKSIAGIARYTGSNWPRIQRWVSKALCIRRWLAQEYGNAFPSLFQGRQWTSFSRDFSWAFYPKRFK